MNAYLKYNLFLLAFSMLLHQNPIVCAWSHNIQSKFSNIFMKQKEETIDKKIALKPHGTLSIENMQGNILIKTDWKQNSIILKATKQMRKKGKFENITIQINEQPKKNKVIVQTSFKDKKTKGTVHYELIIPKNIKMNLKTLYGSIKIKNVTGATYAKTEKGNIKIFDTKGPIIAESDNGNIEIGRTQGNIKAKARYGNIFITDSTKCIHGETTSGNIIVSCKNLHSLGKIALYAQKGNIDLCVPTTTNADLHARTKKGKLISDHYIKIKPQTVKLNRQTWDRFKREVTGTLGTGEALIKMSANIGNIKISKPMG